MHWVIQQTIFKPANYHALIDALDRLGISHTSVAIPNGTHDLLPDVEYDGKVYVCGAMKLARIARDKGWVPGSFLNENFTFDRWHTALGDELLNAQMTTGQLSKVAAPAAGEFFIRPAEDNKAFDGMVIDSEMLADWRRDPAKSGLHALEVIVAPVKTIYREYRLFIVHGEVVTGSVYKAGGKPQLSSDVEDDVLAYARGIIARWTPADAFVMDVAMCPGGLKVIEFNNINSSGFYASDVARYAHAIQTQYA